MVERTQQLKYTSTLIAEEQKLSVSVHTESITERKKSCSFGVLQDGMSQVAD